jgi:protein-S-isoprenylcysteine O-methyltransferase Ste14
MSDEIFWRRAVVLVSAVVYWAGVLVKARQVRRQIGRSPNLRPRGTKERLLWAGWFLVIVVWMAQPAFIGTRVVPAWLQLDSPLLRPASLVLGVLMTGAGYAGTLWCYAAMGATWRIGINRKEKNALVTRGPYSLVRHPIYLFQIVLLVGALLLLPTVLSAAILAIHVLCVFVKASDEESYLLTVHGQEYRDYLSQSGMLLPRWRRKRLPPE